MSYTCAIIIGFFKPLYDRELRQSWCKPCGSTMLPLDALPLSLSIIVSEKKLVRKRNVTDRQTDRQTGVSIYVGAAGDKKHSVCTS